MIHPMLAFWGLPGGGEWIVILVVAVLIFGRRLPDIARAIGKPNAVRAVGAANGRNPLSIIVPCHRVIGQNGSLTGYAGGLPIKQALLTLERASR